MREGLRPGNGVVIEWFELFGGFTDPAIVPEMERDRLDYAAHPGFIRKLLVVAAPPSGGELAGGIYFLSDPDHAKAFLHWATYEHVDPTGNHFEDREYVGEGHGYVGELIGHVGANYDDWLPAAVRMQRHVLRGVGKELLAERWASQSHRALDAHTIGVSLAYDAESGSAFVISVSGRRCSGKELDRRALDHLASSNFAATLLADTGAEPAEDILFWVFTVWEGYAAGGCAPPSTWPNSPPLPHASTWKG